MRKIIYHVSLDENDNDVLFVSLLVEKKPSKLIEFSLCYVTLIDNNWKEIVRFDCAHGGLHEHKFYLKPIEFLPINKEISQELFHELKQKIQNNWMDYKTKFFENYSP